MYTNKSLIELVDVLYQEITENNWLKFKKEFISNKDMGKDISALSNGACLCGRPFGYLIFGVDDKTHEIKGTTFDYRNQKQGNEELENWLNRLVSPKIGFSIYEVKYAALKRLVFVEIPAAFNQPTSFHGVEYIRIGSYRQELRKHPEVEKKLWYSLGRVSWEQEVSLNQNLHFKFLSLIAESKGIEFSEDKFATLRFLDNNGRFNNLAFLMSDENSHVVKFAVYRNNSMDFAVKKEFTGSWVSILEQVLEYVNIYNDTSASVHGSDASRTEIKSYPDPSLREAVVNAFAHFDANFPSDIKIEFYPDRVEIGSPGSLYRITMKDILEGRQSFRNPNLVYVLNKFNFIENYATGLKKILFAYNTYSIKPKIETTDNFFIVTLPNVNYDENSNDTLNDTLKEKLAENDTLKEKLAENDTLNDTLSDVSMKVLGLIRNDVNLLINDLITLTGKSRPTITRALAELTKKEFIAREGSKKFGHWKVLK